MSLNSMRKTFHNTALGKWILGIAFGAMMIIAFTGIGANLLNSNRGAQRAAAAQQAQGPDAVVATVNGQPITRRMFDNAYSRAKQQQQMFGQTSYSVLNNGELRAQALQSAISAAEAVQVARQSGVTATDQDIQKAREAQVNGMKGQLGLPATASDDEVNASLQKYGAGSIDQQLPDNALRQQVLLQKYQDQIKHTIVPTDAAMKDYFKQVHARHILISNKTRPDAQAKVQAQQLIDQIKGGADLAALAKQHSDDPGSKNTGGDDGWITQQTQYVPEFLKAALALNPGQVTPQPVLSPTYGYFIIQALAVKENYPADYQKNKAKYQQQVAQSLQNQAMQSAFESVSKNATVVVNDPLLRAYWTMSRPPAPGQSPKTMAASVESDLNSALKNASYSDKAEIYAMQAIVAAQQKDTKGQIAALNNALATSEDPQLRLMLGEAYRKQGDTKNALAQYKLASSNAWDNPTVHMQLQQAYTQMQQPQLATAEATWLKSYQQRQRTASAIGAAGAPGVAMPTASAPAPKK